MFEKYSNKKIRVLGKKKTDITKFMDAFRNFSKASNRMMHKN